MHEPLNHPKMLAGLIFAVEEAEGRPGTLMATLPFGGMTLLEYQARLLFGAGAEQVLVAVGKMTPALLAAVNRAAKRHPRIEIVRSAEEAAEKIAPGAQVLVMADGLVTTDPVMDKMATASGEALLVTDDPASPAAIERLDMRDSWAGVARITVEQLAQIAQMPEDYDFQSALLRVAAQSGAEHVPLTAGWLKSGHAVERSVEGLAARNTGVLAALTERRTDWADRWVFTRAARIALPELVGRNVPGWSLSIAGGAIAALALVLTAMRWPGAGTVAALAGTATLATGAAMAVLRGEDKRARLLEWAIFALFALIALLIGWGEFAATASTTPPVLALVAMAAQLLVERAPSRPKRWWSSPSAHLLILTPFALAGFATIGLAAVAIYSFATLAAAVEGAREKAQSRLKDISASLRSMSDNPVDMRDGSAVGARELLARAAAAELRAYRGLMVAVEDFFLPEEARLDEHSRAGLAALLRGLVETVEGEIREHAVRLLTGRGEAELVGALIEPGTAVLARLWSSGLLRDGDLMAELIARVRQEMLGTALPMSAPDDPERPSLINRFVQHPDRVVAASAMAVLIAESRRRTSPEVGQFQTELPAELHHKLVWWTAAALREGVEGINEALDRALCDAAQRSLAAYDEGDRLEAAAMRFAAAIDAQPGELSGMLVESLGDRRVVLFIALLAHAMGVPYALARDLVLDPAAERLWLALRALEIGREGVAQIGYALSEADPRRDLEKFADTLDTIAAIAPAEARNALAPLRLDPDYRAARIALQRGGAK